MSRGLLIAAALVSLSREAHATLVVYPAPSGATRNTDYTVQVREEGGTFQETFAYLGVVGRWTTYNTSFVYFDADFSHRIEVKVTKSSGSVSSVRVRPRSYGIPSTLSGNTASFFLDRPRKLSVEFDGDIYKNLQVFANPLEVSPPHQGDAGVIYFGPGVTNAGSIQPTSGQTVYIAGGAVVLGKINPSNVSNVVVRGRGILDGTGGTGSMMWLTNDSALTIEGIIITNSNGWTIAPNSGSHDIHISNVKIINHLGGTDGIDPVSTQNMTVDDVFIRNGDDCMSIKAQNSGTSANITVTNSVFWSDAAHGILIGPEGTGMTTSGLTFRNIDILELNCPYSDYWGAIGITNGMDQTLQDITFQDIRVEDFTVSNLVDIRIEQNTYAPTPGKCVKNINFINLSYTGTNTNANVISGYDATRYVDGVTFESLRMNGSVITSAAAGNFQIGGYAYNITFVAGPNPPTSLSALAH